MPAWDNVQLPGSPGAPSYAAPLVNFSALGDLADSYYKSAENQRRQDLANAFKDGLPRTPDGQIDYRSMSDTLAKKGGVDQAISVANTGAQLQAGANFGNFVGGGAPPQPVERPTAPVFAPPPDKKPAPQQAQQPGLSSAGTDDNGSPSVRSISTEVFGGKDVSDLIPRFAKALGLDPDAPLSPEQAKAVQTKIGAYQSRTAQNAPQGQPQGAPQGQPQGVPQPRAPAGNSAFVGLVPQQWLDAGGTPEAFRDRLAQAAANPLLGANAKTVALERMKAIDAVLGKNAEATPEMKNATASGVASPADLKLREAQETNEVARFGKKYDAISKAGAESAVEIPKLAIAQQDMSQPGFFSGPTEGLVLAYRRILATIDPTQADAARPQEVFRKVMQDSIRSNIQSMAASGVGRIMLAEVKIIEKSNANPENTPASNRTLVEINRRQHQLNVGLDQFAQGYKGGRLDPGFDAAARQFVKANPMFTPEETKNPKLLGAPIAPANITTPQQAAQWASAMKLQKGDAIRLADGSYRFVP